MIYHCLMQKRLLKLLSCSRTDDLNVLKKVFYSKLIQTFKPFEFEIRVWWYDILVVLYVSYLKLLLHSAISLGNDLMYHIYILRYRYFNLHTRLPILGLLNDTRLLNGVRINFLGDVFQIRQRLAFKFEPSWLLRMRMWLWICSRIKDTCTLNPNGYWIPLLTFILIHTRNWQEHYLIYAVCTLHCLLYHVHKYAIYIHTTLLCKNV